MPTEKVFVIYYPYLAEKLYYASNTEWNFEIEKSTFFESQYVAEIALNRLQSVNANEVINQGLEPQLLAIDSQYMEVDHYIHLSYP